MTALTANRTKSDRFAVQNFLLLARRLQRISFFLPASQSGRSLSLPGGASGKLDLPWANPNSKKL
jgi:hypothetical protein